MPKPNLPFTAAVERRSTGPVLASRRMNRVLWAHVVARSKSPMGRVTQGRAAPSTWRTVVGRTGIRKT